jgi:hypothetical protein
MASQFGRGPVVQVSYSDVFSITHEREHDEEIAVGDLVRTGPNLHPHHRVIAVQGEKAWIRNEQSGLDAVTAINRCRKVPESG